MDCSAQKIMEFLVEQVLRAMMPRLMDRGAKNRWNFSDVVNLIISEVGKNNSGSDYDTLGVKKWVVLAKCLLNNIV